MNKHFPKDLGVTFCCSDSKSQLRTQDGIRVERKERKDVLAVSALRGSCGPTAHGFFLSCLNCLHLQNTRPSSFRVFHSYPRPEIQSQKHRGGSSLHLVCPGPSGCLYVKRGKSEGLGETITLTQAGCRVVQGGEALDGLGAWRGMDSVGAWYLQNCSEHVGTEGV